MRKLNLHELKFKDAVNSLSLNREHVETNRTSNFVNAIAPCQSPKDKASTTVHVGDEINPEAHLLSSL